MNCQIPTASLLLIAGVRWGIFQRLHQGSGGYHGPDASDEGVQRDLLPLLEGSTVATRYGEIKTDYILFIASGEA